MAPCLQKCFRHPHRRDDDAIVGMAMDVRDSDRKRLELDRAARLRAALSGLARACARRLIFDDG